MRSACCLGHLTGPRRSRLWRLAWEAALESNHSGKGRCGSWNQPAIAIRVPARVGSTSCGIETESKSASVPATGLTLTVRAGGPPSCGTASSDENRLCSSGGNCVRRSSAVAAELDKDLRSVVDYPAVALSVAQYGKAMFEHWTKSNKVGCAR